MGTRDHEAEAIDLSSGAVAEALSATGARASASLQGGATWRQAVDAVDEALTVHEPDLAVVFVDSRFAPHYEDVLRRIRLETGARHLIGCSGAGVIGPAREAEGEADVVGLGAVELEGVEDGRQRGVGGGVAALLVGADGVDGQRCSAREFGAR